MTDLVYSYIDVFGREQNKNIEESECKGRIKRNVYGELRRKLTD